jgi:photosystem II stability/assembly factor-like uncharacterized protein
MKQKALMGLILASVLGLAPACDDGGSGGGGGVPSFVAVGGEIDDNVLGDVYIYTSHNGTDWKGYSIDDQRLTNIAYGNKTYVAVGVYGSIMSSKDGRTWKDHSVDTNNTGHFRDVVYGQGTFVTVGTEGWFCTSSDGETWSEPAQITGNPYLKKIAYGNNIFVASESVHGDVYTSSDGSNWNCHEVEAFESGFTDMIYTDQFIGVDLDGIITYSENGIDWTTTVSDSHDDFYDIAYGNGQYMITGNRGMYPFSKVSTNLTEWVNTDDQPATYISALVFGKGRFVAVGQYEFIMSSADNGDTWDIHRVWSGTGVYIQFSDVAYGGY